MDAALGWIGDLIYWVSRIFPRLLHVVSTRRVVFFVRSGTVEKGPGLHVFWPVWTKPVTYPVVRQVLDLPEQKVTTSDGQSVVVDGVVTYSIADLSTFLAQNYEAEDSITDLACVGVQTAITGRSFSEIQTDRADEGRTLALETRLRRDVAEALAPFGVEVERVRLAQFAKARVFAFSSSGAAGTIGEGN